MHLPTASQILCSITMGLGEKSKLRYASKVQSRNITVNGILQISACVCNPLRVCMCVHVCTCQGILCVHVHKLCEPTLFGFVICKGYAKALPVRGRVCVRVCVQNIIMRLRVCNRLCARTWRDVVYCFSVARLHDGSQHQG